MKLLEMGKYMKIKHSVFSHPYKVWGNIFRKKSLHGGTNAFGKIYGGGGVNRGTNDQIMQGGEKLTLQIVD